LILVSGIALVDLIASGLDHVAGPGELVFGSVKFTLGGHACNVSVDLAQLGFPKSRLRVVFPAGRDMFGRFLVDTLRARGLHVHPVYPGRAPTSLDLILVARGEDRRYHADPGANIAMPAERVLTLLERHRPLLFYNGGAGLLNRMDERLAAVLKRARRLGARTFVDVVCPYRQSWDFLRRALPSTDFIHCNSDEASDLTGERRPERALGEILRFGAKYAFVTLGEGGVLAAIPGSTLKVPAFTVKVTDPTGAGDAFSAGLIMRIYDAINSGPGPEGLSVADWKDILVYASACGAVCCAGIGTTASVSAASAGRLVRRLGPSLSRRITVSGPVTANSLPK
jgi:sugar/nucleoside kinase (ribokinase family)